MELYEPLEVIGSGAFGQVTKIRRKSDGRTLVWKELNYGSMSDREKQQTVAEVNIIRELRSPFIVRYYDRIVDKQNTKLYIVMEYCAGGDLGHVIKKCKRNRTNLEEAVIWKALAQLLLALKDCHHREDNGSCRPILHRDIKPANVLLDQNKNIKLGDFGLAKELSSAGKLAQTHVGTPFYMSPELISGRAYDEKSDIWAIGCLLYELAALRPPFDAHNQLELAVKIKSGKYHRIPSKYSSHLTDVIGACLQVDPSRRPRLAELESMTQLSPLQNAIGEAKKIIKEYEMYQSYSDKWRELKAKEEALRAKEVDVAAREEALSQLEERLRLRERDVQSREEALAAPHTAESESQQVYSDMMDIEPAGGEARMSLCADVTVTRTTKPLFSIHCDKSAPNQWKLNKNETEKKPLKAKEQSDKENISVASGVVRRSAKIDNILARASALTQHRGPPPVPGAAEGMTMAKKLMTETPVLMAHASPPDGNTEAIYISRKGDEGSASKRRRRSEARAPPPPPKKTQEDSVASVHVDLRTLLPHKDASSAVLRTRNSNFPHTETSGSARRRYLSKQIPGSSSHDDVDVNGNHQAVL